MKRLLGPLILAVALGAGATARASVEAILENRLSWETQRPLSLPLIDDGSVHIAYKDPTMVRYGDSWHMIASRVRYADGATRYSLVYFKIDDWSHPENAKAIPLRTDIDLSAPNLFYYAPHKKWYVFHGWGDKVANPSRGPAYSTFDDINHPETLTPPKALFATIPASLPERKGVRWLDYTVIGDEENMHLFFTNDGGDFLRSTTRRDRFPEGWSDPVLLLREPTSVIFEGSCTYRIKDQNLYLTIIEAISEKDGTRFFTSFVADRLDGEWRKVAGNYAQPFAGAANVRTADGSKPWSTHISHGELLCVTYDESMIIDPADLQLVYQGWDRTSRVPGVPLGRFNGYHEIPWRLSFLRAVHP